ncbi:DUF3344 domain-containing protein, partial [Methanobrevibacter sp.]|uniref:DUF3344 domain-containing protein n=1 Tax=Methanobrevibacter sp. TaxID=66852 RepID=UPI003862DFA1
MKLSKVSFVIMVLLIVLLSISTINAEEIDDSISDLSTSNDDIDLNNDEIVSLSVANDEEILDYSNQDKEFYINFDEEDITIAPGESVDIQGDICFNGGSSKVQRGGFDVGYYVDDLYNGDASISSNGHLSFSKNLNLAERSTPYKINFAPNDSPEYWDEFCPDAEGEVAASWVFVTVQTPVIEDPTVIYVDSSYAGSDSDGSLAKPYAKINDGVGAVTADKKTVHVADGTYNGEGTITINKNMDIIGESSGVIVNNAIFKYTADLTATLVNLTINGANSATTAAIDIAKKAIALNVTNVTINNWVVEGSNSVILSKSTSPVVLDNVNVLNTKGTAESGTAASSVIFASTTTGGLTIKNSCINNTQFLGTTNSNGVVKCVGSTVNMDNVTIFNTTGRSSGLFHLGTNGAVVKVDNSKILGNNIQGSSSGTTAANGVMFYAAGGSSAKANITVENSIIKDNIVKNHLAYTSYGIVTLNYNAITGNTQSRMIYSSKTGDVFNADYNWWGSNTNPDPSKIDNNIIMNVTYDESTAIVGSDVLITADFTNCNSSGVITPLPKNIGNLIDVNFNDEVTATIDNGIATASIPVTSRVMTVDITADDEAQQLTINSFSPIIYVDCTYDDDDSDGSEDRPYKTIKDGIAAAIDGQTVYIANGEYNEGSISVANKNINITGDTKDQVIVTKSTFAISGTANVNVSNLTIKDSTSTVFTVSNNANLNIDNVNFFDINAQYSYNSGAILRNTATGTVNMKNTLINNARAPESSSVIWFQPSASTLYLDNVTITNSAAGFALYYYGNPLPSVAVNNSRIVDNRLLTGGGNRGYVVSGNAVTIENSVIKNNTGRSFITGSNSRVNYNVICDNEFTEGISLPSGSNFDYNWWGSNAAPKSTINNPVVMTTSFTPATVNSGENVTVTADFTNYNASGTVTPLSKNVPDIEVNFNNVVTKTTNNGIASASVKVTEKKNVVSVISSDEVQNLTVTIKVIPAGQVVPTIPLIDSGVVSGGVDLYSVNPWTTSGSLTYTIPESMSNLNSAYIIVNDYSGSGGNNYALYSNITLEIDGSTIPIAFEALNLSIATGGDENVYSVDNHANKQYSDYQIIYDISDELTDLNAGDSFKVNVANSQYPGKQFDGKIKEITLLFTYDDGDNDNLTYWCHAGQLWGSGETTFTINTRGYNGKTDNVSFRTIDLSSSAGTISINNNQITPASTGGNYYHFNTFENISSVFNKGSNTVYKAVPGGASYKTSVALLVASEKEPLPDVAVDSVSTLNNNIIFPGLNNTLTIKVNNNEVNAIENVRVELYSNESDELIGSYSFDSLASGTSTISLVDPTIRPITENTVLPAANNNKVSYTAKLYYYNNLVSQKVITPSVVYNGYLNRTYAFNGSGNIINRIYSATGDVIISPQSDSQYKSVGVLGRTETWNIETPEGAVISKVFVYFPYNWDTSYFPNGWTVSFNNHVITNDYISHVTDKSNLGYRGSEVEYGLVVYDVTDYYKANQENVFDLSLGGQTALYPSTLVVLYNTTGSRTIKDVYFTDTCDVLYPNYNMVGYDYAMKMNIPFNNINVDNLLSANWYSFSGSSSGNVDLKFNDNIKSSAFAGWTANDAKAYVLNVTDDIQSNNDVWFITKTTSSTTVGLEQILVVERKNIVPWDVVYVNYTGGNDDNYGDNWNEAVKTLEQGLNRVKAGGTIYVTSDDVIYLNASTSANGITINKDVSIIGYEQATIHGKNSGRIFNIANAKVNLTNLTLTKATRSSGGAMTVSGSTLIIDNCTFSNNNAGTGYSDVGGAINTASSYVTIKNSVFDSNAAGGKGGAINAENNRELIIDNCTFTNNQVLYSYDTWRYGSAIAGAGTVTISQSVFTNNNKANGRSVNMVGSGTLTITDSILLDGSQSVQKYNSGATLNVDNNWWGNTNENKDSSPSALGYTVATVNTYLILNASADDYDLFVGDEAIVTVSLNNLYSDGQVSVYDHALPAINLTIAAVNGTADKDSVVLVDGVANVVYTAGTVGNGSLTADYNGISTTVNFEINEMPPAAAEATLKSEYTSIPSIYAGVVNNLTLTVANTGSAGEDVVIKVLIGDELVGNVTIADYAAGETYNFNFIDETIRPITENTAIGNNNENVTYTVVVEDANGVINSTDFSFVVLYNGNLGKDYEYPSADPTVREFTASDVIVLTNGTYSAGAATNRTDVYNVALDGSVSEALLYVSYNWDKAAGGDFNTWNATFNNQAIVPVASYRDQGNLGKYGAYGYGLVVYNVTSLVADGENTFALEKVKGNAAVYPSSLIVLVDDPSSLVEKTVYIVEEADLLAKTNNKNLEASFTTLFDTIDGNATLYVFAAGAQAGEGNLIINDDVKSDVWSGTSSTFDIYETDVAAGNISVKFEATGSTILGLHQMVVVENAVELPTAETTLKSEYTSVPSIYAGVPNNLTLTVANNGVA